MDGPHSIHKARFSRGKSWPAGPIPESSTRGIALEITSLRADIGQTFARVVQS